VSFLHSFVKQCRFSVNMLQRPRFPWRSSYTSILLHTGVKLVLVGRQYDRTRIVHSLWETERIVLYSLPPHQNQFFFFSLWHHGAKLHCRGIVTVVSIWRDNPPFSAWCTATMQNKIPDQNELGRSAAASLEYNWMASFSHWNHCCWILALISNLCVTKWTYTTFYNG